MTWALEDRVKSVVLCPNNSVEIWKTVSFVMKDRMGSNITF
jgi:hypothetical protein